MLPDGAIAVTVCWSCGAEVEIQCDHSGHGPTVDHVGGCPACGAETEWES